MHEPFPSSPITLEESLKIHFGYNGFRECQKEIISAILKHQDVLAVLPTGAGKSICYQLPAILLPGIAIVVSPLISLMQDQVISLSKKGIPAAFLNSSLHSHDIHAVLNNLSDYKLLYVAPERLSDKNFLQSLKQVTVSFFAIDEAHCISQWGHAFRPEYRQLFILKELFPTSSMVALTATATKEVEHDIIAQLAMRTPFTVRASFDRPNLSFHFHTKTSTPLIQLKKFLDDHKNEAGIIYASTRKIVEGTYLNLLEQGFKVGKYHAGMSDQERGNSQDCFIHGQLDLMVATVAFGMGIHKPDIRFIVHLNMPHSIEQYYQEVGRAGRDGLSAECLLLFSVQDLMSYNYFLEQISDETIRKATKIKTEKMYALCRTSNCRRKEFLRYFDENYFLSNCGGCDNCIDKREEVDETTVSQKILSCVFRLEQRFGIKYVIDVLRGLRNKKILENGHDHLTTYGLMKDYSEDSLRYYIDALIEKGFLTRSEGEYPVLQWTKLSSSVTRNETKVILKKAQKHCTSKEIPPTKYKISKESSKNASSRIKSSEETLQLFLKGYSIFEISQMRNLSKNTLIAHLVEQIQLGKDLDITPLVSLEKQKVINQIIVALGVKKLTPIKEALPKEISYEEISLVAAFHRRMSTAFEAPSCN